MPPIPAALAIDLSDPVRDPIWHHIYLPRGFRAVIEAPDFMKLAGIRQLGPAWLAYPGATHTRYSHSLGVLEMARRLLSSLAGRVELDFLTDEGVRSFLVASLCHDVGHFPWAHSLKELPLVDHEVLTGRALGEGELREAVLAAGADPDRAAAIVDSERGGADRETLFYRGLLSGVLDPDKLDYLNRDAYFCGVPYGLQDADFALSRLALAPGDRLAVDARGVMSVEAVLFSKYLMYRAVYWHRTVRSATAMVKKAVSGALAAGRLPAEGLYGLDDAGFVRLALSIGGAEAALVERVVEGRPYRAIFDEPFDADSPASPRLLDLARRAEFEEDLSRRLSTATRRMRPEDVVVDVPEPVSFETELPVVGDSREAGTVFGPDASKAFSRSLRRIRVLAREGDDGDEAAVRAALETLA
ncbi:MAG: HD domain-containing protein [Spirochaetales bacterium]|nr:HD domain-containing protein [Spirochaetales bacterium]